MKKPAIEEDAEFLLTLAEANGAACSTVRDGHVLVFKKHILKRLIETTKEDKVVIFVKRPEVQ